MSRTPSSAMCSVRGIGVAVIVSTSTVARSALSRSLTSTPNRCSSSMISRPRLAKFTSGCASRCVPMTISTPPCFSPSITCACCFAGREAAERGDREGKLGHAAGERAAVLLGEDRRRHEHGDLVAGIDGFERGAHRDFGLAVARRRRRAAGPSAAGVCMSFLMAAIAVSWSGVSR